MDIIYTLYWMKDNKYRLLNSWNEMLCESANVNDICKKLKEEDVKAKERDKNSKKKK